MCTDKILHWDRHKTVSSILLVNHFRLTSARKKTSTCTNIRFGLLPEIVLFYIWSSVVCQRFQAAAKHSLKHLLRISEALQNRQESGKMFRSGIAGRERWCQRQKSERQTSVKLRENSLQFVWWNSFTTQPICLHHVRTFPPPPQSLKTRSQ